MHICSSVINIGSILQIFKLDVKGKVRKEIRYQKSPPLSLRSKRDRQNSETKKIKDKNNPGLELAARSGADLRID